MNDTVYAYQVWYDRGSVSTKTRTKSNGTWGNWETVSTDIPTFYKDYANLSSLANALGGLIYVGTPRDDANVIGTYFSTTSGKGSQHFPTSGSYWTLISIGNTDANLCFQIAFNSSGVTYYRTYWNGWHSWVEM